MGLFTPVQEIKDLYQGQRIKYFGRTGQPTEVTVSDVRDNGYGVGVYYKTTSGLEGSFLYTMYAIEPLGREPSKDEAYRLMDMMGRRVRYHFDHPCRACDRWGMGSCEVLQQFKDESARFTKVWNDLVTKELAHADS